MSNKWKIALGIVVVVLLVVALGALGWGERVYRLSDGQRGWSLGAYMYQVFGWGQSNYLSDFGRRAAPAARPPQRLPFQFQRPPQTNPGHRLNPRGQFNRNFGYRPFNRNFGFQRFSRIRPLLFFIGGLGCLVVLALLIVLGIFLYRRQRRATPPAATAGETPPAVENPAPTDQ